MSNKQQEYKSCFEEQLQWFRERDSILEIIEEKLHKMKTIAEYALQEKLTLFDIDRLNGH